MPGPAGLLFQQSQTPSLNAPPPKKPKNTFDQTTSNDTSHCEQEEGENDEDFPLQKTSDFSRNSTSDVSFYSPAWMVMQLELGFRTPSLQAHLSPDEKYEILRPLYPAESHFLIPDIVRGKADWNISPRSLLVLVQTSQALTDNLWTVSLMDETCATLDAWIQPTFVKKEQQQDLSHQASIQPGLVWLVQDATVMLVSNKDRKAKSERMLLIKQENIQRVWSPSQADEMDESTYTGWIDRRNTLTAQICQRIRRNTDRTEDRRLGSDPAASSARFGGIAKATEIGLIPSPRTISVSNSGDSLIEEIDTGTQQAQRRDTLTIKSPSIPLNRLDSSHERARQTLRGNPTSAPIAPKLAPVPPSATGSVSAGFSYTQTSEIEPIAASDKRSESQLEGGDIINSFTDREQAHCGGNMSAKMMNGASSLWASSIDGLLDMSDESDDEAGGNIKCSAEASSVSTSHVQQPRSIFQIDGGYMDLDGFSDDED